MKLLLLIFFLNTDSIKVKILKVKEGKVIMKTMDRPRVKFITKCDCHYRKKDIVFIKRQKTFYYETF